MSSFGDKLSSTEQLWSTAQDQRILAGDFEQYNDAKVTGTICNCLIDALSDISSNWALGPIF